VERLRAEVATCEQRVRSEVAMVEKDLESTRNQLQVMRAKLFLDQLSISFKIVPEYPDLVDENKDLHRQVQTVADKLRT
jgi:hypothetical protein